MATPRSHLPAGQLGKQFIEAHDVASLRRATARERDAEHVEECVPLKGRQLLEHDSVSIYVDVRVEPCPPLVRLKGKAQARARRCIQQMQKSRGRLPDRFGRHPHPNSVASCDNSIRRDTAKWFSKRGIVLCKKRPKELSHFRNLSNRRSRRDRHPLANPKRCPVAHQLSLRFAPAVQIEAERFGREEQRGKG
jgi:hypothetical protein